MEKVDIAPDPVFGAGTYCSSCRAGVDHALAGTIALGKTQRAELAQPGEAYYTPGDTRYPSRADNRSAQFWPFTRPVNELLTSEKLPLR